ncbi:hypothetical protein LL912_05655 [Niabella sp. CC-SYL272]|uniref:hypothetical protein n=1 Tax=Niabella agricola TaxID=2891571 RepID=UPI001F3D2F9C|nr:hypothetical protein [Niabella agricola]MCF3108257.1 hypothetical protein [Niabella agricola]
MRIKFILMLLLVATLSCGGSNNTRISVNDQDGELRIRVYIRKGWHNVVNYDQRFPSAGLNKEQRDRLVSHIVDSLKQQ